LEKTGLHHFIFVANDASKALPTLATVAEFGAVLGDCRRIRSATNCRRFRRLSRRIRRL